MWTDKATSDMPLILHDQPLNQEAYSKYFRNYKPPAEPDPDFKHWHQAFYVGVRFEICNLPVVGVVVFIVKEKATIMLRFDQLKWIMAAEDNYENRDEHGVTKAHLHFYLPDCTTVITEDPDENGVWQAIKFVQQLEPRPKPTVEISVPRVEFGELKEWVFGFMHKVVENGGGIEGLDIINAEDRPIYRSLLCPHCSPEIIQQQEVEEVGGDDVETLANEMANSVLRMCPGPGDYETDDCPFCDGPRNHEFPVPHDDDECESDRAIVSDGLFSQ